LCQETFAAAWSKLDSFAGKSGFGTWLHRIAYRRFLDWLRAKPRGDVADSRLDLPAKAVNPLAAIAMDDDARALYAALDRVDQPHRDVLVLHYLLDFSYRGMSAILDEPIGTMKWRTSVALEEIRKVLGDAGKDDVERRREKSGAPAANAPTAADPNGA
jgi:RNA polymerase sigma-70 factor (ECF subfamily)